METLSFVVVAAIYVCLAWIWVREAMWERLARPDAVVGGRRDPQMRRWFLWKSWRDVRLERGLPVRFVDRLFDFNVCVHHILRCDPPGMHDHAWWNATIVLKGVLYEVVFAGPPSVIWDGELCEGATRVRWLYRGAVRVRRARDAHWLNPAFSNGVGVWTLFITGPWRRNWGYWRDGKWIDWRQA